VSLRSVNPVIQRNSYFAHPENLLIAMATDERPLYRTGIFIIDHAKDLWFST